MRGVRAAGVGHANGRLDDVRVVGVRYQTDYQVDVVVGEDLLECTGGGDV